MTRINTAVTTSKHSTSCAGFFGTYCDCTPIKVAEIRRCVICTDSLPSGRQFYCSWRCSKIAHPKRDHQRRRYLRVR